jgi:hypothetical protein
VRRDAVERAREREVRTLRPATATVREGTHCVTTPVVSGASRPDRREATHEQRSCNEPARDLCRDHQQPALTRGHGRHGIEALANNRAELPERRPAGGADARDSTRVCAAVARPRGFEADVTALRRSETSQLRAARPSLTGIAAVSSIETEPAAPPTRCLQDRGRDRRPRRPWTSIRRCSS